jgi:putative DNA primase/helicase
MSPESNESERSMVPAPLSPPPSRSLVPATKTAEMVRFSEVVDRPVEWLWPDHIALGKLTLLIGDPGMCKSFLTIDWAARVSCGGCWPGEPVCFAPRGSVIFLSAEDDPSDTILQRLKAAGADLTKVAALTAVREPQSRASGRPFSLRRDLDALEAVIEQTPNCRLVVIDPISAYMDGIDDHRNADVRNLLHPLVELAAAHRIAVVAVTHLNKNSSRQAIYRAMGSLAFVAQARTVWGVVRDPADRARRLLVPVKNNITDDARGLVFCLPDVQAGQTPRIEWQMVATGLSMDTALAPAHRFDLKEQKYRDHESHCAIWLREELCKGPMDREILTMRAIRFSEDQLYRAADRIGVLKIKGSFNGGWVWMLPEQYDDWHQMSTKMERARKREERKEKKRRAERLARRKQAKASRPGTTTSSSSPGKKSNKPARKLTKAEQELKTLREALERRVEQILAEREMRLAKESQAEGDEPKLE